MRTEFNYGIRRSGSQSLRKDVARRMIFDHLRLMSSPLGIQQRHSLGHIFAFFFFAIVLGFKVTDRESMYL